MIRRFRGVRGVRRTPRRERAADSAEPKTPGYLKNLICGIGPRRDDSRSAGGTRNPRTPHSTAALAFTDASQGCRTQECKATARQEKPR